MTQLFTKVTITFALFMFAFGAFGFATSTNIFINEAHAVVGGSGGCGSCGGGSTGGGTNDGSNGGDTSNPPRCEISTNVTKVNANGQYTISWNGTPAGSTFKLNNLVVPATGSRTYTFDGANIQERFVFSGLNSDGICAEEVIVYKNVNAPTCDISTNISVVEVGQQFRISWVGTPAQSTTFKVNGTVVAATDATTYTFPADRTSAKFTFTATNAGGTCSDEVVVTKKTADVPTPVCEITGNPHTITRGSSAQLSWTSQNAVSASLNQGIGAVAVNSNRSVSPNDTTTYTLTVKNSAGVEATCTKTITVQIPTPNAPICDSFTASPSTITRGQSSQLTWNTTNANTASINNAVGSVSVDGSVSVSPLQTTTYTLTAVGAENKQVSCPVTVTVNQPEADITCSANVNFNASPTSIRRGDSSTLTWSTNGLTSVSFSNLNSTGLSGSVTVNPSDSTTYTLIGKKGSQTIECPVRVDVSTSNGGGGGGSSAPKCTLKISDNKISLGERITIKWDTTRATEVTLKDNHGKTLVDTDDKSSSQKKELYDGEITIRPEKDTTYTLVAEKGSRDKTCKVSVDVEDNVVVTQVRDQQPLVTGIALTNVPYTGFEAGPFMTSVFYTLLAAWALYMAYVLVGRRNGMNASAFTPALVTADVVPTESMFASATTAAPVFYQTPAPVATTTATVGYEAHTDITTTLEAQAHAAHVLVSADALAYFIAATATEDRAEILSGVLAAAKASYPSEGGWVTLTADRMVELAAKN